MPYQNLCNGTEQKSPEVRSELNLTPSRFTPLHKFWYGIVTATALLLDASDASELYSFPRCVIPPQVLPGSI